MPRGPELSWAMKQIIWDLAAKLGPKPEAIFREIDDLVWKDKRIDGRSAPDPRTIRKVINELQTLSVSVVGTLPRHVQELRGDWPQIKDELLAKENLSPDLRTRHIDRVMAQVESLRSCLTNPEPETIPYADRPPLQLMGHDWRLDPVMWLHLCAPDLSDERLWGPEFELLKQHMKASPFWGHLEELGEAVKELEKDYESTAEKLGAKDEEFRKSWESLRERKAWATEPFRTPHSPQPDETKYEPYYGEGYCSKVMREFLRIDPAMSGKQVDLEKRLQQLWDDLLPHNVEPIIESGRCVKCAG